VRRRARQFRAVKQVQTERSKTKNLGMILSGARALFFGMFLMLGSHFLFSSWRASRHCLQFHYQKIGKNYATCLAN